MKKITIAVLLFSCFSLAAQISEGGMPFSFYHSQLKALAVPTQYKLKKLENKKLLEEDSIYPSPYRYSSFENANLDIKDGSSMEINEPDKGTIWRYSVTSENAVSIQIIFQTFIIPSGAKLFIYNSDYSEIYGAFTEKNVQEDKTFIIADFPGQQLIIEYFEPSDATFKGIVKIGQIGQAYKNIFKELEATATNYIDINCEEGKTWQNEKHAICRITFRVGSSGYLCTGSLINNTKKDGTPYFLTANHCISDTATAKTLVAYFNYEKKTCNGATNASRTLSGANLMTTGTKSDYTLLKLNTTPPASYLPYYAGWDISNYLGKNNVGIHHPEGLEKKISFDFDSIITYDFPISWDGGSSTPPSSHWLVNFDAGLTNEGSSGSPLFNNQKNIIGQLHGGGEAEEFYGKLNYSWTNSTTGYGQLKTFLDPENLGINFLPGYAPTTNPPDAFFTTQFASACLNTPIALYDYSAFAITSREWVITPSSYNFLNGTNQNSIIPEVAFTAARSYSIKLKVANTRGKDSLVIDNAITAGNTINVDVLSSLGNTLCYNNFDSLILTGRGANSYTWGFKEQVINPFYYSRIEGDTAILKRHDIQVDSTYSLTLNISGTQGTCTDTAKQIINFVKAFNDNIANAIQIGLGTTKSYSNLCATIEEHEPVPPSDSCTGPKSWCDEYGTGKNIVEHSVWFKFIAPPTGKVGLKSAGFDNEIAIYDATSYQDILNGNFNLIAANDDESNSSSNPSIPEVAVVPGKVYWIQVDGSGGGSEGSFTLTLSDKRLTGEVTRMEDNSVLLYPHPVGDILSVHSDYFNNTDVSIQIYDSLGKLVKVENLKSNEGNEINIKASDLNPGMYILNILTKNKRYTSKFVKN